MRVSQLKSPAKNSSGGWFRRLRLDVNRVRKAARSSAVRMDGGREPGAPPNPVQLFTPSQNHSNSIAASMVIGCELPRPTRTKREKLGATRALTAFEAPRGTTRATRGGLCRGNGREPRRRRDTAGRRLDSFATRAA